MFYRSSEVYDLDFNSIKVRLKRPYQRGAPSHQAFQFHKGTIKTDEIKQMRGELMEISIP